MKESLDLKKQLESAGYLKIKMRKIKTQHFICRARINGAKAHLLIDTGASNSCMNLANKERFNLEKIGASFEASGAGEDKMKAAFSNNCKLQLGKYTIGVFTFMLLDMQHINNSLLAQNAKTIDGILGADFLTENKALIDYAHHYLWIRVP